MLPMSDGATQELAYLDGRTMPASEAAIPATDDGLIRGDGVFEVVRVYDGRPFAFDAHLDRLERSTENLRLGREVPRGELEEQLPRLVAERGGEAFDGQVRIILKRGGRTLILTEPLPPSAERPRLAYVTFAPSRILDGIKSLSYAGNMLAGRIAQERGFDEALLVTPHGRVLEAPTSSIFWVEPGGDLCTPPLEDHILASITRDRLMRVVDVKERHVTTDELLEAEEAFLASTTREAQPVGGIEDRAFSEVGERTTAVREALLDHIRAELG
jgi:branched-subunit amino acid aminotransferase/4-amino-4-deoxychorismate lyase